MRNLTTNRRTGKVSPSKKIYKKGKIEKLTTCKDLQELQENKRVLTEIALKNKKRIEDVHIKITKFYFGDWHSWSNDVY